MSLATHHDLPATRTWLGWPEPARLPVAPEDWARPHVPGQHRVSPHVADS